MGVPPNHLFYWDILYKPSIFGTPPSMETPTFFREVQVKSLGAESSASLMENLPVNSQDRRIIL